jgi:hypothetical protein
VENERRAPTGRASSKILELQMQTALRCLADLTRRRRWEAAQAGVPVPARRMVVSSELSHVAVSGEGTAGPDGAVDSSVLRHPSLQPQRLREAAAEKLFVEELYAMSRWRTIRAQPRPRVLARLLGTGGSHWCPGRDPGGKGGRGAGRSGRRSAGRWAPAPTRAGHPPRATGRPRQLARTSHPDGDTITAADVRAVGRSWPKTAPPDTRPGNLGKAGPATDRPRANPGLGAQGHKPAATDHPVRAAGGGHSVGP